MESEWQWWLISALALVYGLAVLALVIAMLAKSMRAEEKRKE
jgi:uncharacterized membrane-anchored protein YhcB (DUF1043 family)